MVYGQIHLGEAEQTLQRVGHTVEIMSSFGLMIADGNKARMSVRHGKTVANPVHHLQVVDVVTEGRNIVWIDIKSATEIGDTGALINSLRRHLHEGGSRGADTEVERHNRLKNL